MKKLVKKTAEDAEYAEEERIRRLVAMWLHLLSPPTRTTENQDFELT